MSGKGGINFTGKWELSATENYPEWLEAMGVSEENRQKYVAFLPSLEVVHEGDTITYISRKGDEVKKNIRHMGVEYLDTAHNMNEMRVPRWEGNQLVIKAAKNPPGRWTTTCEMDEDKLLMCYTNHQGNKDGVTAKRWFTKVGEPDFSALLAD